VVVAVSVGVAENTVVERNVALVDVDEEVEVVELVDVDVHLKDEEVESVAEAEDVAEDVAEEVESVAVKLDAHVQRKKAVADADVDVDTIPNITKLNLNKK